MEVSKAINAIEITVELNLFPNEKKVFGRWKTIQNVILNGLQSWYIIITSRNVKLRNFLHGYTPARLECLTDAADNSNPRLRVNGKWRIKLRKEQVGAFYAELLSIKCSFTMGKLQLDPLS